MRRFPIALLVSLAASVLACTPAPQGGPPQPSQEQQPVYGGRLNVRVNPDPWEWDLSLGGKSSPNDTGIGLTADSLLGFKVGPDVGHSELVLQPELAQRWEVSPDARSFTFNLRQDARFANTAPVNGRELTSADVKFSMEYASRSGEFAGKKPTGILEWMYEEMERIETPDKHTVTVRFKEPFVPFAAYMASEWSPVLAREVYDRDGHMKEMVVGSGPFVLDRGESQKGSRWVWKKNPTHWREGKPYLDELRWLVIPE